MATYKLDVAWKYGRFQVRTYAAAAPVPEFDAGRSFASIQEALTAVDADLKALRFDEDRDTLIFRNVAYSDLGALRRVVRDAVY